MPVYAGKYGHFPENSSNMAIVRFEPETMETTDPGYLKMISEVPFPFP